MVDSQWRSSEASIAEILATLPGDRRFHYPIRHGTMRVGMYAPQASDPQKPHTQDELYIIASGSGMFAKGDERVAFATGDVLFVRAGEVHRFEEFTDDFSTWVIFWGAEGGE